MELYGSSFRNRRFHLHTNFFLFISLLALPTTQPASSQKWDGVLVTQSDYQSLQAVKNELVDHRGVLRSWNGSSGDGVCSGGWAGIKCIKGQVIAIQLPWRGLGGTISDTIGQLPALKRISLHDNVIGGSIPWSLGFLRNLRGVYLFNNQLRGFIPPSIGNCSFLQALDVSNNSLHGPIPPSLANSPRLYRLNLSYNSLTGSIPASLTRSASLVFLALEHNNISASIPDSRGGAESTNNPHQLQFLTLNHNQITGSIPNELGHLSSLQKLDLSNNAIHGTIPSSFPNLSSLVWLNLEGNLLDGPIPEALDRIQNLTVLNLKNNILQGPIPSTIGNISAISKLDFSQNNFSGEIPSSLSHLSNLDSFNVSYNNLSGSVPSLLAEKFNSSSFVGNLQLCGYSSSTPCPSSAPISLPSAKHHGRDKLSTKYIALIIAASVVAFLLLLCCCLLCCLMRKRGGSKTKNGQATTRGASKKAEKPAAPISRPGIEPGGEMGGKLVHFDGPFIFTTEDLLCATAEIMGKSSYGTAYKATLEDGNQVAVKRMREKTTKGEHEFESEAAKIGKIRHPNLLPLRAYYLGPKGEKLLVFDYMSRGSLSSFLHARGPETIIDWPTRMKIIIGITRGLNHLHTKENTIHGNLTSSNVLLDEQTNTHIADFGITNLMTAAAAAANVIATAGTQGYRAPELSSNKNASTKTDVYSLGVIILELLTGKSPGEPINGMDLPRWVASAMKEEWTNEVFDLEILKDLPASEDEILNTLKLALHCVDPLPSARPEIEQVLEQLEEIKPELAATVAHHPAEIDDGVKSPPTTN